MKYYFKIDDKQKHYWDQGFLYLYISIQETFKWSHWQCTNNDPSMKFSSNYKIVGTYRFEIKYNNTKYILKIRDNSHNEILLNFLTRAKLKNIGHFKHLSIE